MIIDAIGAFAIVLAFTGVLMRIRRWQYRVKPPTDDQAPEKRKS